MNIGQKIKHLREAQGITLQEIGDLWGISRSSVAGWESGSAKPGIDKLPALARRLGTTVDELLSERELPRADDPQSGDEAFTQFRRYVERQDPELANYFDETSPPPDDDQPMEPPAAAPSQHIPGAKPVHLIDDDADGQYRIRRVTLRLQAGITGFTEVADNSDGGTLSLSRDWVDRKGFNPERLISMGVRGESMEPTLYEGDTVIVNLEDTKPVDNGVYAINYGGEPVVKRLSRDMGKWWLMSDNPDQRRFYRRMCQSGECIILGRVVRRIGDHL